MNVIATIEDLLEVAAGMTRNPEPKIKLDKEDITIMHSIARQVFKGTALTDRQFALMQEKLSKYKDQFSQSCDFDSAVVELRKPLREIDRSKYIKVCKLGDEIPLKSFENNIKWIKIRFPFNKTLITDINELVHSLSDACEYHHSKGSHEHYFSLTELSVYEVITKFYEKNFDIEEDLLKFYKQIKTIKQEPHKYLSGIFNNKLVNVKEPLKEIIKTEIGILDNQNYFKFVDRKNRYGITVTDKSNNISVLDQIVHRKEPSYHSKPKVEPLSEVLGALWQLDRFPMLVVLDKNKAEEQLHEMISYYRDILDTQQQSVLFRLSGESGFNTLVKDRKLNNWVDTNTKIVYISSDKLPKLLVNNEWKPSMAFLYNSALDKFVNNFVSFNCDLIIYREDDISPFRRYSRLYG